MASFVPLHGSWCWLRHADSELALRAVCGAQRDTKVGASRGSRTSAGIGTDIRASVASRGPCGLATFGGDSACLALSVVGDGLHRLVCAGGAIDRGAQGGEAVHQCA